MKNICLILLLSVLSAAAVSAQTLSKDELVKQANTLYESGRQKDSLALIGEYPAFLDDIEILYIRAVAHTELREYDKADIAFQKQFDIFLANAAESLKMGADLLTETPVTKENKELAAFMYATALISCASADLTEALRAVAFEKNGRPEKDRVPKNLAGYDEFRRSYEETAIKAGELHFETGRFADAAQNFTTAIELDPENPVSYRGRAKVYRKLKKLKAARADEASAARYETKR
jgi:tetratricopeptide (TPR) repeat protein